MAFFRRKQNDPPAPVDPSLPASAWLSASESAFNAQIAPFYGTPETMAGGAAQAEQRNDPGVALFFFAKSVDMLHTAYDWSQMESRRPSRDDTPIVDGFVRALAASLALKPDAPVSEVVRTTTHRLRAISLICEGNGLSSDLYHQALVSMTRVAPQVDLTGVLLG